MEGLKLGSLSGILYYTYNFTPIILFLCYLCIQREKKTFITDKKRKHMKLAEALSIRKDLQKRIQQLETRIRSNVKVQEDEEPLEDPNELTFAQT